MKNAFFIGFSKNYIPGVHALINSIKVYNHDVDIVLTYDIDSQDYIDYIKPYLIKFKYNIKFYGPYKWQDRKFDRWKTLFEIFDNYDCVCILDADTVISDNLELYFHIANSSGVIVGNRDQSNRTYKPTNYVKTNGEPFFGNKKIHFQEFCCGMPLFLSKQAKPMINSWKQIIEDPLSKFGDMETINLALVHSGLASKLIAFPTEQFTQTHLTQLSPKTRIGVKRLENDVELVNSKDNKKGILVTDGHLRVKSIHGKYWIKRWVDNQLLCMENSHIYNAFGFKIIREQEKYLKQNELKSSELIKKSLMLSAKNSMNIIMHYFVTMLNSRIPFNYNFMENQENIDFLKKYEKDFLFNGI